jgi:MscS family membrane protein
VESFLQYTLFGNPIEEWLIALLFFVGSVVLAKVLYAIFGRVFKTLAARTTSQLDDVLIDSLEEPIVFAVVVIGIWKGYDHLDFGEATQLWMQRIFRILIAINITWLIVRLIDAVITEYLMPKAEKSEGSMEHILPVIRQTIKVIVWTLGIVLALNNVGYDVGALLAGVGIGGLALAMAAKDFVANIFGGITVFVDKPFKVGDRIQIAGLDGFVTEVGIRSTRIRTLEGRIITIPNFKFTDTPVENVSIEPARRVKVTLGLTYNTSAERLREAQNIMREVILDHPHTEDEPLIWFEEFGAFSLNLSMYYYIVKEGELLGVPNDVNLALLERFNAAGFEFAFPTQTVYHQAIDKA